MKLSFPLAAAFAAVLSLSACGGGGGDSGSGSGSGTVAVSSPAALTKTDTAIGTGTEATNGSRVQVNYTGWLYNASAKDFKGTQFDSNASKGLFTFVLGQKAAIDGFDQGVLGMKVGGKRTILVPSSMAYGSAGVSGTIPANSGLVFEVELVKVCGNIASICDPLTGPTALTKTDVTVGTGAEATAGAGVQVNYTGWLYDPKALNNKGAQFDSSLGKTPFNFVLGKKQVIDGFDQGVTGMKVGGKRVVVMPSSLGYGATGSGSIPPNTGLIFEIDLLKVCGASGC